MVLAPDEARVRAISEIVSALVSGVRSGQDVDLNALKSSVSRKYVLARAPKLVEIIAAIPEESRQTLLPRLKAKPVRTASGIAVVAVMSKPHRCPHIATTGGPTRLPCLPPWAVALPFFRMESPSRMRPT